MRIYDIDKGLEKFIEDGKFQIEIVGEGGAWTITVSKREWRNDLQRYVYEAVGGYGGPSFLAAYDFIAGIVGENEEMYPDCSLGYNMLK